VWAAMPRCSFAFTHSSAIQIGGGDWCGGLVARISDDPRSLGFSFAGTIAVGVRSWGANPAAGGRRQHLAAAIVFGIVCVPARGRVHRANAGGERLLLLNEHRQPETFFGRSSSTG